MLLQNNRFFLKRVVLKKITMGNNLNVTIEEFYGRNFIARNYFWKIWQIYFSQRNNENHFIANKINLNMNLYKSK